MNHASQNNGEALCREILAAARTEADRLVRQAHDDAATLMADTTAHEESTRQQRLDTAREEADRRRDRILATVPVEAFRLRATRLETILQSIHDAIRRRLFAREGFDSHETVVSAANYAINRMAGSTFVVAISPADHATFGASLADDILERTEKTGVLIHVIEDAAVPDGGVMIHDDEGREEWDNRLASRLERLWPVLRPHLADILPGAMEADDKREAP